MDARDLPISVSAHLEAVLKSVLDAIYIGNATGITVANQRALDMLGFDSIEELNRDIGILAEQIQTRHGATGERIAPEDEPFARALRGESVVEEVIILHRKSGKDVHVRCAAAPIWTDGRIAAALAINTDITESVDMLRRMEALNRDLEQANSALLSFGQVVSHDLKEPVRAIQHYIQEAREHAVCEQTIEYLAHAHEAQARLSRQMAGLFEMGRSAITSFTPERVVIGDVLHSETCRNYYAHILSQRKGRLEFIASAVPVLANRLMLAQVLGNLLLNACKHSAGNGLVIRVNVSPVDSRGRVQVAIEDNGPGYPQALLETQASARGALPAGGLGLAIARDAVKKMGGELKLGTAAAGGARASFDLLAA